MATKGMWEIDPETKSKVCFTTRPPKPPDSIDQLSP